MAGVIVMTGATRGIGQEAARRLLADGRSLLVGARDAAAVPAGARALPLDLTDLASVRGFAAAALSRGEIDALVLNAGIQASRDRRTADGYEETFAVNHLAHYLLARLILAGQAVPRIVVTASGVHDPAARLPFPPPPRHADAGKLADPATDPQRDRVAQVAGGRAYAASKLANILFVRSLAKHAPATTSIAYDPAYVPGTGLGRDAPRPMVRLFEWLAPRVMGAKGVSTVARSGAALARLATDPALAHERAAYWSMRGELVRAEPSTLARDDGAAEALWVDSARLVGLEP